MFICDHCGTTLKHNPVFADCVFPVCMGCRIKWIQKLDRETNEFFNKLIKERGVYASKRIQQS